MNNLSIREIKPADFNRILAIADEGLGNGYITKTDLQKCIEAENMAGWSILKNESVVGFCIVEIVTGKELVNWVEAEKQWFQLTFSPYSSVGIQKHTVIQKAHQKSGLGKQLIATSTKYLENRTDYIVGIAWQNSDEIPVKKIFNDNQYFIVKSIEKYWAEDSLRKKYSCPACGAPPCTCNAQIFVRYNNS